MVFGSKRNEKQMLYNFVVLLSWAGNRVSSGGGRALSLVSFLSITDETTKNLSTGPEPFWERSGNQIPFYKTKSTVPETFREPF